MQLLKLVLLGLLSVALVSCGGDKSEEKVSKEAMPAAAPMAEASGNEVSRVIDHSRDEIEFQLRRSLAGLDRMIEQYTADGYATSELEKSKAQISAELEKFMGGS